MSEQQTQDGMKALVDQRLQVITSSMPNVRQSIEDKVAQIVSAIQTGGASGMQTLDMRLKALVTQGVISREAAREKARVPTDI